MPSADGAGGERGSGDKVRLQRQAGDGSFHLKPALEAAQGWQEAEDTFTGASKTESVRESSVYITVPSADREKM